MYPTPKKMADFVSCAWSCAGARRSCEWPAQAKREVMMPMCSIEEYANMRFDVAAPVEHETREQTETRPIVTIIGPGASTCGFPAMISLNRSSAKQCDVEQQS